MCTLFISTDRRLVLLSSPPMLAPTCSVCTHPSPQALSNTGYFLALIFSKLLGDSGVSVFFCVFLVVNEGEQLSVQLYFLYGSLSVIICLYSLPLCLSYLFIGTFYMQKISPLSVLGFANFSSQSVCVLALFILPFFIQACALFSFRIVPFLCSCSID